MTHPLEPGRQQSMEASMGLPPLGKCWRCTTARAGAGPTGLCLGCVRELSVDHDEDEAGLHAVGEALGRKGCDVAVDGQDLVLTTAAGLVRVTRPQARALLVSLHARVGPFLSAVDSARAHISTVANAVREAGRSKDSALLERGDR